MQSIYRSTNESLTTNNITVSFSVKSILNVRLSESADNTGNISVLELLGDVLIVPQVSQCFHLQGTILFIQSMTKLMQAIGNISKQMPPTNITPW